MLGGADNPNGELPSYITGANNCVHHIWCPLFSQEFQDLPDGAETTLTKNPHWPLCFQPCD